MIVFFIKENNGGKNYVGSILSILAVLSTLLIFAISWWKVLIINICAIAILLIFFKETITSGWVYLAESILCIGIMVLVICFPEKVCGGMMSKPVADIAGSLNVEDKSVTIAELTKRFRIFVGIGIAIFIVNMTASGSIYIHSKGDVGSYSLYLSVPISCLGGFILLSSPLHIMMSMGLGIPYGVILTFMALSDLPTGDSDSDYGGGSGGDSYDVIIIKH